MDWKGMCFSSKRLSVNKDVPQTPDVGSQAACSISPHFLSGCQGWGSGAYVALPDHTVYYFYSSSYKSLTILDSSYLLSLCYIGNTNKCMDMSENLDEYVSGCEKCIFVFPRFLQ
jgi:hypothetical protein